MKLQNAIGETIRELRQEKQMTLRQLSALSFVSLGHLSEVERSVKLATPELLECIAFGLEMPTWKFLMEVAIKMSVEEGVEIPDDLTQLLEKESVK
jgi:transcriptional regulator with XRE-family HTH domain